MMRPMAESGLRDSARVSRVASGVPEGAGDAPLPREMLASSFPDYVSFAVATPRDLEGFELYSEEAAALSPRAARSRHVQFRLGRCAARRALAAVQGAPAPVPVAADRRPLWPEGLVGAITH